SYVVPAKTTTIDTTSGEKSGRTVTLTAEDMQRKKNDVKARTTLLLSLPDEHQVRFSKYKTTRELWAAIMKTIVGNEATKKTKKNLLKQQYGNFKEEGSENLEQTFNRLQVIIGQLKCIDVEIEQDDLNQNGNEDGNTACVPTASTNVPTASASVATISQDTACAYIASQSSGSKSFNGNRWSGMGLSYMANDEEDHALVADEVAPTEFAMMANTIAKSKNLEFYNESNKECIKTLKKKLETLNQEKEGVDGKLAGLLTASKDLDNLIESQKSDKNKEGLRYTAVPPPPVQLYLSPEKDLSWTGLLECADDTVTDYSRPSPTVE
nr:hypothetical protein [Tanacetum cinerariifolium]